MLPRKHYDTPAHRTKTLLFLVVLKTNLRLFANCMPHQLYSRSTNGPVGFKLVRDTWNFQDRILLDYIGHLDGHKCVVSWAACHLSLAAKGRPAQRRAQATLNSGTDWKLDAMCRANATLSWIYSKEAHFHTPQSGHKFTWKVNFRSEAAIFANANNNECVVKNFTISNLIKFFYVLILWDCVLCVYTIHCMVIT